jgi:hypothetical protein
MKYDNIQWEGIPTVCKHQEWILFAFCWVLQHHNTDNLQTSGNINISNIISEVKLRLSEELAMTHICLQNEDKQNTKAGTRMQTKFSILRDDDKYNQ